MSTSLTLYQKQKDRIFDCCKNWDVYEKKKASQTSQAQYVKESLLKLIDHVTIKSSLVKDNDKCNEIIKKKLVQLNINKNKMESIKKNSLKQNVDELILIVDSKLYKDPLRVNSNIEILSKLQKQNKVLQQKLNLLKQQGNNTQKSFQNLLKLMQVQSLQSLQSERKQIIQQKKYLQELIVLLSDIERWQFTKNSLKFKLSNYKQSIKENLKNLYNFIDKHYYNNFQGQLIIKNHNSQQIIKVSLEQKWKIQRNDFELKIRQLQNKIKQLQEFNAFYDEAYSKSDKTIDELNNKINSLEIQNSKYKNQIYRIKKNQKNPEVPTLMKSIEAQQVEKKKNMKLNEYQRQIQSLKSTINKLNYKMQKQNKQFNHSMQNQQFKQLLKDQIKRLKEQLAMINKKNLSLENQKKFFNVSIERLNVQIEGLKKANDKIKQDLHQNQDIIKNLRKNQIILRSNSLNMSINQNKTNQTKLQSQQMTNIKRINSQLTLKIQQMQQQLFLLRNSIIQGQEKYLSRLSLEYV